MPPKEQVSYFHGGATFGVQEFCTVEFCSSVLCECLIIMRHCSSLTQLVHMPFLSVAGWRFHSPKLEIGVSFIYRSESGGLFVTFLETVTPLELERSVFDSDETRILSAAFERAWAYVQFDPMLGVLEAWERQAELARCLMVLLKLGDNNPVSLANSGIALLHKSQRSA